GGGQTPAQAGLTLVAAKDTSEARLTVTVDRVAAADIAAQSAPLAFLGVLDAPISGQISSTLDTRGRLAALEARLSVEAGALRPTPQTRPVPFEAAGLFFTYDPASERIDLRDLTVQSASLRLTASGQAYLPGVRAGLPDTALGQIRFSQVMIDPEGLFVEPVRFTEGALDLRVKLDPFSVDIGQLSLTDGAHRLVAKGAVAAEAEGWRVGVDIALDEIAHDRLLALWPVSVVPRTREWIFENVQEGQLFDVKAALRLAPGTEPRLSLGYEYAGADVRFLRTLPPIEDGYGYASLEGKTYTQVINRGHVTSPTGGMIDVAGSVFAVADITQKPATADITLKTEGSLTATLSLLDEPPFNFLTKANQPVTLGEGRARAEARLRLPLRKGVRISDVDWTVAGRISDFRSDTLVPGRALVAADLGVSASPAGLEIAGKGTLEGVPFDGVYRQRFSPEHAGTARIEGSVELSQAAAEKLKLGLPAGLIRGVGRADVAVDLVRDVAPRLSLQSTLEGVGLAIPALGWAKPQGGTGRLEVEASLGKPAAIDRLELEAAGLSARGSVRLKADGTLDLARFSSVRLGGWLDATVDLAGRGAGQVPAVSVTGGSVDLRRMDRGQAGQGGGGGDVGPLRVALDRLTVTEGIALTGFRGTFATRGGLNGDFNGRVNGKVPVTGSLAAVPKGSAVRVRSEDAGGVFSAAGIFPNARGGSFEMVLQPRGPSGDYDGSLKMTNVRIRNAPVLAELLSAISVVGILEQMNQTGLLFSEADAEFRLTPRAIEITRAAAVGASLGVSLAGLYITEGGRLDMQGVISPIYLLNGIGAFLTRRGEGLFGFNYAVKGTAANPSVSVNPLSIFTPGMFREIFRSSPPKLETTP
ncbi:MAG: DUF3971 domain-containing protein, partial [Paracoccaceae bacterium]|nr:DUF3971 domain-containing protein [Paracoccaceae bacterium]